MTTVVAGRAAASVQPYFGVEFMKRRARTPFIVFTVIIGLHGLPDTCRAQPGRINRPYYLFVGNGRIVLVPGAPHNQSHSSNSHSLGRSIQMQYRHSGGDTSVDWTAKGKEGEDSVSIQSLGDTSVRVTRTRSSDSEEPSFSFTQSPGKPLEFRLGEGESARTWKADNLWLLLLQCPDEYRTHLLPILTDQSIGLVMPFGLEALRDALVKSEVESSGAETWKRLVAQLNDDSFARREAADRALRAEGTAALAYLRELDLSKLAPEQQFRIAHMLRESDLTAEVDNPAQVVSRLRNDPRTWLFLLGDPAEAVRRSAVEKLAVLLGRDIEFDPGAEEPTRRKQLADLTSALLKDQPDTETGIEE